MSYYTYTTAPIGRFVEKDCGNYFEYSLNDDEDGWANHWPHKVWVGSEGPCGDRGYRYAHVKRTVAYVVTDEDDAGAPVVEKWSLKNNTRYAEELSS
jgi:hypothetical protein